MPSEGGRGAGMGGGFLFIVPGQITSCTIDQSDTLVFLLPFLGSVLGTESEMQVFVIFMLLREILKWLTVGIQGSFLSD